MNSNDFIRARLEKIKNSLGQLPVPENMDNAIKALDMFNVMINDIQIIYWVMYVRHKMALVKSSESSSK